VDHTGAKESAAKKHYSHPSDRKAMQPIAQLFVPPEIFTNGLTVLRDPFAVGEFDP
jgi:hypothetical protein